MVRKSRWFWRSLGEEEADRGNEVKIEVRKRWETNRWTDRQIDR